MKTKEIKRSDRKAKRKLKKVAARAQDAADELVSSDDEAVAERDHSVKANPTIIADIRTPRPSKKKTLVAKEEAQKATDEADVEDDPSKKRALLLEALQLEQSAGRLDHGKVGPGNTGASGYGGNISLSDLPSSLKKSLDYDSITRVHDFFDTLTDVLVTQRTRAYVPYLLA